MAGQELPRLQADGFFHGGPGQRRLRVTGELYEREIPFAARNQDAGVLCEDVFQFPGFFHDQPGVFEIFRFTAFDRYGEGLGVSLHGVLDGRLYGGSC